MKIGDLIKKKSGKPFQNGNKTAIITGFSTITIPTNPKNGIKSTKTVNAVSLLNCIGLVRQDSTSLVIDSKTIF
jgi:hypothetical protein